MITLLACLIILFLTSISSSLESVAPYSRDIPLHEAKSLSAKYFLRPALAKGPTKERELDLSIPPVEITVILLVFDNSKTIRTELVITVTLFIFFSSLARKREVLLASRNIVSPSAINFRAFVAMISFSSILLFLLISKLNSVLLLIFTGIAPP